MSERPVGMPAVGGEVVAEADCLDGVLGFEMLATEATVRVVHPRAAMGMANHTSFLRVTIAVRDR